MSNPTAIEVEKQKLIDEIKGEILYVDKRPYSHNIIGMKSGVRTTVRKM